MLMLTMDLGWEKLKMMGLAEQVESKSLVLVLALVSALVSALVLVRVPAMEDLKMKMAGLPEQVE